MIAGLNKELSLLGKAAKEFSKKELAPEREVNDRYPFGPFFQKILTNAYEIDFFHTTLPEEMNGVGQGSSALCVILEQICQEDASLGGIILTNTAAQELLIAAGANEQLTSITGNATTIDEFLIAFPVFNNPSEIEPVARATPQADGTFRLSGKVEYVVLGGIAHTAIIPAKIDAQEKCSLFLVDLKNNTINASETVVSLGLNACPAVDIILNNTKGILIGKESSGSIYFETMTDKLQAAAAAMSLGIMKGSLKEALDYGKGREQGGRKIVNWSEVKMILANMAIKIKNAEMILSALCQAIDNQKSGWNACSRAASIHIQEMACELTTDGIQVLGGVGYMKDFGQEKRFRDAKHIQALFGITPMKKINYLDNFVL